MDIEALRAYEAGVLRPFWDGLSGQAAKDAGVLNWDAAPASAWNRERAVTYSNMVTAWAIKIPPILEQLNPDGTSDDLSLTSLSRGFDFHVAKMIFLRDLGISTVRVPSDLEAAWEGFKRGLADLPEKLKDPAKWGTILIVLGAALVILIWSRR